MFCYRNLNAVVYHPKDIGIGPKIYTSIVQMTISQFLGMFQILYDQRRQIIKLKASITRYLKAYVLIFVILDAAFRPVAAKNHTEWSPD